MICGRDEEDIDFASAKYGIIEIKFLCDLTDLGTADVLRVGRTLKNDFIPWTNKGDGCVDCTVSRNHGLIIYWNQKIRIKPFYGINTKDLILARRTQHDMA